MNPFGKKQPSEGKAKVGKGENKKSEVRRKRHGHLVKGLGGDSFNEMLKQWYSGKIQERSKMYF